MNSGFFPRLSMRDITDLDAASNRLAIVADALRAAKYANGPALIQLIIEANDPIVRICAKGAGAVARRLERQGVIAEGDELAPAQDQGKPQNEDPAAAIAEG